MSPSSNVLAQFVVKGRITTLLLFYILGLKRSENKEIIYFRNRKKESQCQQGKSHVESIKMCFCLISFTERLMRMNRR